MNRVTDSVAIEEMYGSVSSDPMLALFHLVYPDTTEYFYVNDTQDHTSNGQLYTAFPFTFNLPSDNDESEPVVNVSLTNVGLDLIEDFRQATEGIIANIKIVMASDPNTAVMTFDEMNVRSIGYDEKTINVSLGFSDILNTAVPSYSYSPEYFPSLFNI